MKYYSIIGLIDLTDKELKAVFLKVGGLINTSKKKNISTKKEEIYYCYIWQEIHRRPNFSVC